MNRVINTIILMSATIWMWTSCSRDEGVAQEYGEATVRIDLAGVESVDPVASSQSTRKQAQLAVGSTSAASQMAEAPQQMELNLDGQYKLIATLTADKSSDGSEAAQGTVATSYVAKAQSNARKGIIGTIRSNLQEGVWYRVLVYNNDQYVGHQDYAVGRTESRGESLVLRAGVPYTFLVYSVGTMRQSDLPTVDVSKSLSKMQLTQVNGGLDFMYYKAEHTLARGVNNLNVLLTNMFSQITTEITLAEGLGQITAIEGAVKPHHSEVQVNLSDGVVSYGKPAANGQKVEFTQIGSASVTAVTHLCVPEIEEGATMVLSTFAVNGAVRRNLELTDLNVLPGARYTLSIRITSFHADPLSAPIEKDGLLWAAGNLVYTGGRYTFAQHQGEIGASWAWNWLVPSDDIKEENYRLVEQMDTYSADRDPCTRVTVENGGWRTPTASELSALSSKYVYGQYKGAEGLYFGANNQDEVSKNPDGFVFLPITRWGSGMYWNKDRKSATNGGLFRFGSNWVQPASDDYKYTGFAIRCVKAKD